MFKTTLKHVNSDELAALIGQHVLQQLLVRVTSMIGFARDSASTNGAAIRRLLPIFTHAVNGLCYCHTLCHVGERFELELLDEFMSDWISLVYSHAGAKRVWSDLLGGSCKGFSKVRWYCRAEIEMEIGRNFPLAIQAMRTFQQREYGDVTTSRMLECYNSNALKLEMQFAAMLDQESLVRTTYELEGDRLEILLAFDRIEQLRAKGRALGDENSLPNVDGVIRKSITLRKGLKVRKYFEGHGLCDGKISVIDDPNAGGEGVESTMYPGRVVTAFEVTYTSDQSKEDFEEHEVRRLLVCVDNDDRKAIVAGLRQGYNYLEDRLAGRCQVNYDCSESYRVLKLARAFDPELAVNLKLADWVDELAGITPIDKKNLLPQMKIELATYLAVAASARLNRLDIPKYTTEILNWWRIHNTDFPTWATAARIVFALTPNSAMCERVFSLMESMFGQTQGASLSDQLQGSLMLRFNKRMLG